MGDAIYTFLDFVLFGLWIPGRLIAQINSSMLKFLVSDYQYSNNISTFEIIPQQ